MRLPISIIVSATALAASLLLPSCKSCGQEADDLCAALAAARQTPQDSVAVAALNEQKKRYVECQASKADLDAQDTYTQCLSQ